ncbi:MULTISPECIES: hypothetical protein [Microbacterium]|uniref:Asp23/Gls24 family envelope stress response protein n=1 Tax=Microbacterium hominis TaxID=162426 RepID=A0A2K9DTE7_9MICO|nr:MULTISPECIES: hypothetical protein [Microbacterium]AUG30496.1 hypothetical protein CXR34_14195 [Microbacterium hominis]
MSDLSIPAADGLRPSDLAATVDAAARAVAGVAELYYAAPLPARLWWATVAPDGAYSVVVRRADAVEATVSIGVTGGRVAEVSREVAARVRDAIGDPDARVTVRVSRITPG